jgi:hypothetical protein
MQLDPYEVPQVYDQMKAGSINQLEMEVMVVERLLLT